MHKTLNFVLVAFIALCLLSGAASAATINSIAVSGNQMTIGGVGFNGTLTVTLDGQKLTIDSSTTTQIVATMNPVPAPGSYRLLVKAGTASATAYVTVPSAPAVVATVALFNQTANIPTTTLYTPTADGLYRFTMWIGCKEGTINGYWDATLTWNDFAAIQGFNVTSDCNNGDESTPMSERAEMQAGQPVTYNVVGQPPTGVYTVFITIEKLI
jgi:hypothetical protein